MRPYQVGGVWYTPRYQPDYQEVGLATWYGPESPNHRTADGEQFDVGALSAAHKTLPLPCRVEVTDLESGRRIEVRVNDRGPFVAGRIIDLSPRAARDLGVIGKGSARVRVRFLGLAPANARAPEPAVSDSATAIYRIQAGAFADRANADRAVALLSARGVAHVEVIDRAGVTLFRVDVDCPAGTTPEALRQSIVAEGFPGAKVIGPS
jgi:rare lipoprotein A